MSSQLRVMEAIGSREKVGTHFLSLAAPHYVVGFQLGAILVSWTYRMELQTWERQSLVGELRSHKLQSVAKKIK